MRKTVISVTLLLLGIVPQAAAAQPTPELGYWERVPANAGGLNGIRSFDLAFGSDRRPVLLYIPNAGSALEAIKWTGTAWIKLPSLTFPGQFAVGVRATSDWAGNIFVGVQVGYATIHVYQLSAGQFQRLGQPLQTADEAGFAVAIDARGPVIAWQSNGFITVRRWNGRSWAPLGQTVNQNPNASSALQSPALAVTGDGKLVVAYTVWAGTARAIAVRVWTGLDWVHLGTGISQPALAVSLGGEDSGAPVVAHMGGGASQLNRWNGISWEAIGQPCVPPNLAIAFGVPSLAVSDNQTLVACGIHLRPDSSTGWRTLVARGWSRDFGWQQFGRGSINGEIALAQGNAPTYVIRADPDGQPWAAWTGQHGVYVSTMVPGSPE